MDNCYGYIRVSTREQKEDRQLIAKKWQLRQVTTSVTYRS